MPARKVGIIGDSRYCNIQNFFTPFAQQGFGCCNPSGTTVTYALAALTLPTVASGAPAVALEWNDVNTLFINTSLGGGHPTTGGNVGSISGSAGTTVTAASAGATVPTLSSAGSGQNNLPCTIITANAGTSFYQLSARQSIAINQDFCFMSVVKGPDSAFIRCAVFGDASDNLQTHIDDATHVSWFDGTNAINNVATSANTSTGFVSLIFRRNGLTYTIYANGAKIYDSTSSPFATAPAFHYDRIDRHGTDTEAQGALSLIRTYAWNGTVTDAELNQIILWNESTLKIKTSNINNTLMPGSASGDWKPSATSFSVDGVTFTCSTATNPHNRAKAAFLAAGVDRVIWDIGVNDAIQAVATATYQANVSASIADFTAAGVKFGGILPFRTNSIPTGTMDGYRNAMQTACSGLANVVCGDTYGYDWWAVHITDGSSTTFTSDGVHPNTLGQAVQWGADSGTWRYIIRVLG